MPQLSDEQAKSADSAESTFEIMPEGLYQGTLQDVEVRPGKVADYWSWRFGELVAIEDDKPWPGSLWENTSLSPNAEWKLKEVFDAFGSSTDTDTDTLLGKTVWLVVSQRTIESGARMGQLGNQVERVLPVGGDPGE